MMTKSDSGTRFLRSPFQMLLNNFFAGKENYVYSYFIDASFCTTIIGKKGTRFTIEPGNFKDAHGRIVRGEVQVHVCEMFDKGEMILNNLMTTSENRLLVSAGQFFLQVTQNQQILELTEPLKVEIPIHSKLSNTVAARLFEGSFSTMLPFTTEKVFDWKLLQTKPLKIRKIADKKYLHFTIKRFNWYSCQYFYTKKPSRNMISARCLSDVECFDDQAAFIVFRDIHSVAPMYFNGNKFTTFNIPSNLAASVIIIGLKNQELFFGQCPIERISSQSVSVQMEAVSESKLLATLHSL